MKIYFLFLFYYFPVLYFTVFSNMLKDTQLHILADSDEHEVVQQVQVILHFMNINCWTTFYLFIYFWVNLYNFV